MTELQLAYNLLRAALDGSVPHVGDTPPEASRWWSLFRLLQRNNVAALCYDAAAAAGAPRQVLMPWLAEREKAVDRHRYQRQVQDDIVEKMRAHGIQTLVLKGTHTAQYYPKPECREFGDLDLYFYDRHADADKVACREFGVDLSNDSHHHTKYDYRGVTVESHYDFVNVHYPPSNRRYEALLKSLVDKKDQLPTTHYPLPTTHYPLPTTHYPLPTFEVLFLLRHMACHFAASRITLRDLADWALTCRALQGKVDWEQVQQTVDDYGMRPFVTILNAIAEKQLGIVLPLQRDNGPDILAHTALVEHDLVYGTPEAVDRNADGLARLGWKLRRWRALAWKRRLVYSDSETRLLLASITSHAEKPHSILHKM